MNSETKAACLELEAAANSLSQAQMRLAKIGHIKASKIDKLRNQINITIREIKDHERGLKTAHHRGSR